LGLNNTDVNTRSGWYSKAVTEATTGGAFADVDEEDPTWGGAPITFPRIQGADVCGEIVAVGTGVDPARIGERVISDNWLRDPADPDNKDKTGYFGSERDGGLAEFTTLPAQNAAPIVSDLTYAELATFSCSYYTVEGMLSRASVTETDTVLVPGASGGVGGALAQLAKRRGARVIALASEAKHGDVAALGADVVLPRAPQFLRAALEGEKVTVVADVVGGPYWANLIDILERGGRYTCSGAIAGPMVEFDLRTFYLRDLTFTGSTVIAPQVTRDLVRFIEEGAIKPALAATYPLEQLREAQTAFIAKKHTGNIVVTP
jgi:NADPH:quinone reductase-like Zn-dependent oxidoreductase